MMYQKDIMKEFRIRKNLERTIKKAKKTAIKQSIEKEDIKGYSRRLKRELRKNLNTVALLTEREYPSGMMMPNRSLPDSNDNPVFDTNGNLLGYTESGNTGTAIIFDNPTQFTKGMTDSKALAIGNVLDLGVEIGNCLAPRAKSKIFEFFLDGMSFNNGTKYNKGDAIITTNSDALGNARYLGVKNGKHQVNFDIGEYEWTVENIRATFIHELEGHGFNGFTDGLNNHHKAYFASMNSIYWRNTTGAYRKHAVHHMWNYYYKEIGLNLPLKYYNIYKNNINNSNKWMDK